MTDPRTHRQRLVWRACGRSCVVALLLACAACGDSEQAPPPTTASTGAGSATPAPSVPPIDPALEAAITRLPLVDRDAVGAFYAARGFAPAWLGEDCRAELEAFRTALAASAAHGLTPEHYHNAALAGRDCDIDTEVLATDAWMSLASDLFRGRVDRVEVEPSWNLPRRSFNAPAALEAALREKPRPAEILSAFAPQDPYYRAMRDTLALYRDLARGPSWGGVEEGSMLKPGQRGERVDQLRNRLVQEGFADVAAPAGQPFDAVLENAVRVFQRRSNLEPDGKVGATTLTQLNRSLEQRIDQLRANLERWRWMQFAPRERHVRVFIADFRLEAWDENGLVREHRVIVGKRFRNTPSFAGAIDRIVYAPRWHVPRRLLVEDKLPLFREDPGAFERLGYELLDAEGNRLDGARIDWHAYSGEDFPYRLQQRPGNANALGHVKILFPNEHSIYLHDTPTRELFSKVRRDFSSGCIRVEDAIGLSAWLLQGKPGWDRAKIDAAAAAGRETMVRIDPVPVYIVYLTTALYGERGLRFLDDLYQRDPAVVKALDRPRTAAPG
jgi:L,D-transpeptidase YcbB